MCRAVINKELSFLFWTLIFALNAFSSWMDSFDIIYVSSFAPYKQGGILFPLEQGDCNNLSNKFHGVQTVYMCKQHFFSYPYTDHFFCLVFCQEGVHNNILIHLCYKCPNVSTTQLISVLSYFELVEPPVQVSMFIHITNSLASALITGPSIGMPTDPSRQNNWKSG
jgi:hypothetical protein